MCNCVVRGLLNVLRYLLPWAGWMVNHTCHYRASQSIGIYVDIWVW